MSDYVQALRSKDESPGSLPALTKEAESAILDKYKDEVIAAQEGIVGLPNNLFVPFTRTVEKLKKDWKVI